MAVDSVCSGRTTGIPARSACICIRRLFAAAPPSTLSSVIGAGRLPFIASTSSTLERAIASSAARAMCARPAPRVNLIHQKMGIHEWMYDSAVAADLRYKVPHADKSKSLKDRLMEVELGFNAETAFKEAQRCLNCDVQTVFTTSRCIECDACVDICPTSCITFTENGEEADLRTRLNAPAHELSQDLYVSDEL
ncbi:hypothetical protein EDM76_05525, partial [bacterium]